MFHGWHSWMYLLNANTANADSKITRPFSRILLFGYEAAIVIYDMGK